MGESITLLDGLRNLKKIFEQNASGELIEFFFSITRVYDSRLRQTTFIITAFSRLITDVTLSRGVIIYRYIW